MAQFTTHAVTDHCGPAGGTNKHCDLAQDHKPGGFLNHAIMNSCRPCNCAMVDAHMYMMMMMMGQRRWTGLS